MVRHAAFLFRLAGVIAILSGVLSASLALGEEATPQQIDFFEKKIRPVLVNHCYECHAAKSKSPKGGLRVDSRASLLEGGDSGPAVVPSDVDESLIISALRYDSFEMPPKGSCQRR